MACGASKSEGLVRVVVSLTCAWAIVHEAGESHPNHLELTHCRHTGTLCSGLVPLEEAGELSWTSSLKSWIDATDK